MPPRIAIVIAVALLFAGCGADGDFHGDEPTGSIAQAISDADPVSLAVDRSCTTSVVKGLSTQLVAEIQCLRPGTLERIDGVPGIDLGSAVFPYLQAPAQRALVAAQKARGATMTVTSALRTLPQQYLLYRWYQAKRCGISLAASPGKSNHESALAVDIGDNAAWQAAMKANSFAWLGANDPVHFDYIGEGRADIAGLSVLAFQRLWNRNHPEDPIAEDSDYGPATAERLAKSPVGGFPKGADCNGADPVPPPSSGPAEAPASKAATGAPRVAGEDDGCSAAAKPPRDVIALLVVLAFVVGRRRSRR